MLHLQVNGEPRAFDHLAAGASVAQLVEALGLKPDRIAVEVDGRIARRNGWMQQPLAEAARVEIVHFVGGGSGSRPSGAISPVCTQACAGSPRT